MTTTPASPALSEADQAMREILQGLDIRFTLEEHFVRLHAECVHQRRIVDACQQAAGKALGHPWFKDDQTNFPGATEEDGVCTGEHVEETIVEELAAAYTTAEATLREREAEIEKLKIAFHDAIRRPLGVTPDSGAEFYDPRMADEAEARRAEARVLWWLPGGGVTR